MKNDLVSAILTCYNNKPTVSSALESIWRQTYSPIEVIVVNDGSTDGLDREIQSTMKRLRCAFPRNDGAFIYSWQENRGPSAARNTGLHLAKGRFIAYLDADDQWLPEKTSLQVQALLESGSGIVGGNYLFQTEDGLRQHYFTRHKQKRITFRHGLYRYLLSPCCTLIDKEVLLSIGGFPEDQHYMEDAYVFSSALLKTQGLLLGDPVAVIAKGAFRKTTGLSQNQKEMDRWEKRNMLRLWKENHQNINLLIFAGAFAFMWMRRIRRVFLKTIE